MVVVSVLGLLVLVVGHLRGPGLLLRVKLVPVGEVLLLALLRSLILAAHRLLLAGLARAVVSLLMAGVARFEQFFNQFGSHRPRFGWLQRGRTVQ